MKFNESFPVLSTVSFILIIFGWVVVAVGVVFTLVVVVGGIDHWRDENWIGLLAALGVIGSGLVQVAVGEAIGVLFAIEKNTSDTAASLRTLLQRASQGPKVVERSETSSSPTFAKLADKNVLKAAGGREKDAPKEAHVFSSAAGTWLTGEHGEEPTEIDRSLMEQYGITFDGRKYIYSGFNYTRLKDAINFAKMEEKKKT